MKSSILILLACSLIAACGTDPLYRAGDPLDERSASVRAALGDTLRLRVGQVAEVGEDRLRILFVGVAEDSRCPRGVDCVWSGDAAAQLRLSLGGEPSTEVTLHTHEGPRETTHDTHLVTLLDVEPFPVHGEVIAPGERIVVLRVTRP